MENFLFWFGLVANAVTVLAGLIAIAGVVWAILGRARLSVTHSIGQWLAPSLTVAITSTGSNPVRDLEINAGTLDDNNFSVSGGDLGTRAALNRGEALTVVGYEPREYSFGSGPRNGEFRFEIRPGEGFYVNVQWRSPVFPWRRSSRTYSWPPTRRYSSEAPKELKGRNEIRFLKRTRDAALDRTSPSFVARRRANAQAIVATDESFDGLVAGHKGPVVVGFGPTWQGKGWEDVQRVLDAFAARYAPRVKVLVVNVDLCPALAVRYDNDVVPIFRVFVEGKVAKSHDGAPLLPELERKFAEYLR